MSVGCDKNTSLAAAQTLAISAFLSGGDLVTFPEYPASNNRAIILSTSNTCRPPGPVMLFRLMVAVSAAPGDKELLDGLEAMAGGPGDGERPLGEIPIAEGGGDVPNSEERNPPPDGLANIVVLVGTDGRGEGGAKLELVGMGDTAPRSAALLPPPGVFSLSNDPDPPSARIVGLDPAELKLEMDPLVSLPLGPFLPL